MLAREIRRERNRTYSIRCLVLGLDNAGKSTVIAKFFGACTDSVAPTVGFQIKTCQFGRANIDFWDVGGQASLRPFWNNCFHVADLLVWVVDSVDVERLALCRDELHGVLREERIMGAELLILANKRDLEGALPLEDIYSVLGCEGMVKDRWIAILPISALCDTSDMIQGYMATGLKATWARRFPGADDPFAERQLLEAQDEKLDIVDWDAPDIFSRSLLPTDGPFNSISHELFQVRNAIIRSRSPAGGR